MTHPTDWRRAIFFQGCRANLSRCVKPGSRAEDPAMAFASIFHDIHQEGRISTVPAHEIETIEAARHKDINHRQPKILERASAGIQRCCERGTMCAYPIRHNW